MFRTLSSIFAGAVCENIGPLKVVNYFSKKLHQRWTQGLGSHRLTYHDNFFQLWKKLSILLRVSYRDCVKKVQTRSVFWSVFSCIRTKSPYSIWIHENTDQKKLRIWTLFMQCEIPELLLFQGWQIWRNNQQNFQVQNLKRLVSENLFHLYLKNTHDWICFMFSNVCVNLPQSNIFSSFCCQNHIRPSVFF